MKLFSFLLVGSFKKYKAIEAKVVAKALIVLSQTIKEGVNILKSDELQALGKF